MRNLRLHTTRNTSVSNFGPRASREFEDVHASLLLEMEGLQFLTAAASLNSLAD